MEQADPPSRRLAALLRDRREELIKKWTARVCDDPRLEEATRLSQPELVDHVPEIVDDLVRVLEASEASEASGRDLGASEAAREHARHRLRKQFPLAATLREFSHFRAALVDLCTEAGVVLDGDVAELVHSTIDENMITGASEMEQARLAEVERQAALRERFIGIFGHDLRSPLQSVGLAISSLLGREDTTAEQTRMLRRARASAARMSRMIHDLLDLTRTRLGSGISIDRRPAALDAVCREAIEELSVAHSSRTIELDAPVAAQGSYDRDRMMQVVCNLVGNAIKHSPRGTPVRVTLREEGGEAVFSVHNQGTAIPADEQPHLFDPFWQGQQDRKGSREDSLGLGLFIVEQIVAAHGGSIRVASAPEKGTTFTVRVPLAG